MEEGGITKSRVMSIAVCLLMITSTSSSITQNVGQPSSSGIIYVDDDNTSGTEDGTIAHPYNTIQEGVDAANSGDTVYVFSGTYNENVVVNTSIELIGEDKQTTIVDGNHLGDVIQIKVDAVLVSGFSVMRSGTYIGGNAGIRIKSVTDCNIQNNKCIYNLVGIFLDQASKNELLYNDCLFNNDTGISSHASKSNRIKGNNCSHNLNHGIHIDVHGWTNQSDSNIIENNICSNNKEFMGIWLRSSPFNIITNNTFSNNKWGLDLVNSDGNLIKNNTISNNSWYNLYLYRSDSNIIEENLCLKGQSGVHLAASSKDNYIFHNNIINNSNQVFDANPLGNHWYHPMLLEGNYWSDYTGVDDGSGIGKHAIAGDCIGDTLLSHPAPDYDFYPFVRKDGWTETAIQPPLANASPDQAVNEGDTTQLDASASYDPDGTIESYEWDFDIGDGLWWETGAMPDATNPTPTHTYGDDGVFIVTLRVTDNDNLSASDTCNVTVQNVNPTVTIESITMDVEIGLRVAGRKYNNVSMTLFEEGNQIGYVSIERMPGSPDEQMAWIPISINFSKSYNATVTYTPVDPPNIGGNPVWIYIKSQNGSINKIHHTFNVQQSKKRDSDHWNHVEPWEVDLNVHFVGLPFEITSHITDPGSDDETLTFTYCSQVKTVTYLNNPPNPDPYPSPEVNPVDIMDTTTLIYEGTGTVTLVVKDDDNIRLGVGEGTDSKSVG